VTEQADVEDLYFDLLDRWNDCDATGYAALFAANGSIVGFDGSSIETAAAITNHLAGIFADHRPARYVAKIREIRMLGADHALLRAAAAMVPPGATDIKPELNAIQVLVATRTTRWHVAHFQSTPARFDGRPEAAAAITEELRPLAASLDQASRSPRT
jgi:uncharacterized protein (TIGR02246 family)